MTYSSQNAINLQALVQIIDKATSSAQAKITDIQNRSSAVSIGDMFEMQILMNSLSQLSEMSTAVTSAHNQAVKSIVGGINR